MCSSEKRLCDQLKHQCPSPVSVPHTAHAAARRSVSVTSSNIRNMSRSRVGNLLLFVRSICKQSPDTRQAQATPGLRRMSSVAQRQVSWDSFGIWDNGTEEPLLLPSRDAQPELHKVGSASVLGLRKQNEDRVRVSRLGEKLLFCAVFDGHGGSEAADFCCSFMERFIRAALEEDHDLEKVLRKAFSDTDRALYTHLLHHHRGAHLSAGTTATVALLRGEEELAVGSVGDSRALLCRHGNARQLSTDHTPEREEERRRIESHGGCVSWNSVGQAKRSELPAQRPEIVTSSARADRGGAGSSQPVRHRGGAEWSRTGQTPRRGRGRHTTGQTPREGPRSVTQQVRHRGRGRGGHTTGQTPREGPRSSRNRSDTEGGAEVVTQQVRHEGGGRRSSRNRSDTGEGAEVRHSTGRHRGRGPRSSRTGQTPREGHEVDTVRPRGRGPKVKHNRSDTEGGPRSGTGGTEGGPRWSHKGRPGEGRGQKTGQTPGRGRGHQRSKRREAEGTGQTRRGRVVTGQAPGGASQAPGRGEVVTQRSDTREGAGGHTGQREGQRSSAAGQACFDRSGVFRQVRRVSTGQACFDSQTCFDRSDVFRQVSAFRRVRRVSTGQTCFDRSDVFSTGQTCFDRSGVKVRRIRQSGVFRQVRRVSTVRACSTGSVFRQVQTCVSTGQACFDRSGVFRQVRRVSKVRRISTGQTCLDGDGSDVFRRSDVLSTGQRVSTGQACFDRSGVFDGHGCFDRSGVFRQVRRVSTGQRRHVVFDRSACFDMSGVFRQVRRVSTGQACFDRRVFSGQTCFRGDGKRLVLLSLVRRAKSELVAMALSYGSEDNSSAVVVPLGAWGRQQQQQTSHVVYNMSRSFVCSGRWA
ncbi:hypothetical protein WMY93_014038 [Mugilogobius chulae]|uniref:PPM-type phosphatase domain-containing protein n=1 Tax=Mugilogobius chulae TaxID=88201 RepID=A0AAW0NU75_9GOBI